MPGGPLMSKPTWSNTCGCSTTSAFFLALAWRVVISATGNTRRRTPAPNYDGKPQHPVSLTFQLEESQMLTILLIVLIIFMLGGWGYGRNSGGRYGNPMGLIGLLLVVALVVILLRGGI